ncbi:MAG: 3-dehydroquinate synthase [Candidatus Promineifilaceae bacterium]|jgi:3-dehydroquinate synthase
MCRKNIVLTGFMGTGKSAVGRSLAKQLGYPFIDTDQLIEEQAGQTIAEIFNHEGEAVFRAWEREIAQELASRRETVIATGGRLMLDPENARLLETNGRVFCLTADPAEIAKRLRSEGSKRPLLAVPNPEERISDLLAERAEGYARFPEVITDGKSIEEIVMEIQHLMDKKIIDVKHPNGRYNVLIDSSILASVHEFGKIKGPLAVITDSNVGPLYAEEIPADLLVTIPAGEPHKTLETVNQIYSQLLTAGLDRQGTIVALGGGVVGDVAGFVAATYMRGVDFVQVPTSLLAMVDASVGGKTGVDLPEGKNLVGAFKQPQAVLIDLATLSTLPESEFASGMAEVIKSGLIADPQLFELVEKKVNQLNNGARADLAWLAEIVYGSVEVKRVIVEEDPYEKGRRAVLNLGHTFGHAVEQVSEYSIRHGEGVAMGLVAAAHLSAALGFCPVELETRISEVLTSAALPVRIPAEFKTEDIYLAMASDKKKAAGQLRFILLREVGDVFVSDQVSESQVMETLHHCGAS